MMLCVLWVTRSVFESVEVTMQEKSELRAIQDWKLFWFLQRTFLFRPNRVRNVSENGIQDCGIP